MSRWGGYFWFFGLWRMSWPRTRQEAAELTEEQFRYLMLGLNPLEPKIREIYPERVC